jgi:hypothetical protein
MVHVDNASAHNSRMTQNFFKHTLLKSPSHLSYPPEIFPLDFSLFEKAKEALIGQEIPDEISLLGAVTEILNEISTDELQRAFRSGIERVENGFPAEMGSASS